MSHNYTSTDTLRSTLRISKANAKKALRLNLPAANPVERLKFGKLDYAPINRFAWHGDDSGNAFSDGRFKDLVALMEGEADLVLNWEGEALCGVRIRNGKFTECEVVTTLAPEKIVKATTATKTAGKAKPGGATGDDLTSVVGIHVAMVKQAKGHTREPTNKEHDGMDGLDRIDYWQYGYRTALEEFAARIVAAGYQPQ